MPIAGYTATPCGSNSFIYEGPNGLLWLADGQRIPGRMLVVPGLDIRARQDAWTTGWATRNERIGCSGWILWAVVLGVVAAVIAGTWWILGP